MTPATIRRIVQEIRHQRELLTAEEKWAQTQAPSEQRTETFRRITFWRDAYVEIEQRLGRT